MQTPFTIETREKKNSRFSYATTIRFIFLAAFFLILSSCASLPKDVERIPSYALIDTTGTSLEQDVEPLISNHPGQSGFYALPKGIDALAMRLEIIRRAEKSIDAQYYIWHDDIVGKALHNRLLLAADRGVRVRLLLDDMDTAGKDEMLHLIDAHSNIEIRVFNPFANRSRRVRDFITDARRVNHRMHNKTLTVDNQAAIFGGRNIGDEYFGADGTVNFTDLDALAIGPVAQEISQQFDLYWNSEWVYPLASFRENLTIENSQVEAFRHESDAFIKNAQATDYGVAVKALDKVGRYTFSDLDFQWSWWKLFYDHPRKVEGKGVSYDTYLAPKLKKAIDETTTDLIIVSPYFVPNENVVADLISMVKRGVRVRILTNSLASNDVSLVHAGYMRHRKPLLEGGVELYELKPETEKKSHSIGSSRASLHGKHFCFDRKRVFIGSFNLDGRSIKLNCEIGVYFESPKYAEIITNIFDQHALDKSYQVLLNDGSLEWLTIENGKEVRYNKDPKTGFWKRFSTSFFSLFVPEEQL